MYNIVGITAEVELLRDNGPGKIARSLHFRTTIITEHNIYTRNITLILLLCRRKRTEYITQHARLRGAQLCLPYSHTAAIKNTLRPQIHTN